MGYFEKLTVSYFIPTLYFPCLLCFILASKIMGVKGGKYVLLKRNKIPLKLIVRHKKAIDFKSRNKVWFGCQ